MRVIQIVSSLSIGDGIGNDCLAIRRALKKNGYETEIYAEHISPKVPQGTAKLTAKLPRIHPEDVILYHMGSDTPLNYKVPELPGKKVFRYHNVTPPDFFAPYNAVARKGCVEGLSGARHLAQTMDYVLTVSEFDGQDLKDMGCSCPISIMPPMIPFEDYKKTPDAGIIEKYKDGKTNLIFVGRISPNKCQEDIIRAFSLYKKYYNPEARLFLVGSGSGMELYERRLREYAEEMGVSDVYFTGHIPFEHILAYYSIADAFVCMSEHEGFCVPLVEAMLFRIPVLAFASSAIPETLGGGGVLLDKKDMVLAAAWIDRLVRDSELRAAIIEEQQKRLEDFSYEKTKKTLLEFLKGIGA